MIKQILLILVLIFGGTTNSFGKGIELQIFDNIGGDFILDNVHGGQSRLSDFKGSVILLYFGYITCPDVCPTTLTDLVTVMEQFGEGAKKVKVVFVTIDPERDTTAVVKSYLSFFDSNFIGLRGSKKATSEAAGQFRVSYIKRELGSAAGYLMDHTAFVYLIDQQGQLRFIFPFGISPDKIINAVSQLVD